jgi:sensor histidine kinase YesM
MATRGRGIFPNMVMYHALLKHCKHSVGHIYFPIIMKLGQMICPNDILDEFKNGSSWWKNMAAKGAWHFSLYG